MIRFGLTGDGSDSSTADIDGRYGWAWVRYDEEPHKVSQVRNRAFPGIVQDVPVVIGKKYPSDKSVEILGINWALYEHHINEESLISFLLPPHGDMHHAVLGTDPAYMDVRNMLPGRVRATDPATPGIYVEAFAYAADGTRTYFTGGGLDLQYDYPGSANHHRYALIYLDTESGELRRTLGPENPVAMPPTVPDTPSFCIPLALIRLVYGETTIIEERISDYRIMWMGTGPSKLNENLLQWMHFMDVYWTMHTEGDL